MKKTPKKPWRRTGLSRSVLLVLADGAESGMTVDEVTAALARRGPRETPVTSAAVWIIVDRARKNGLIACNKRLQKRPYRYHLTAGGVRRVDWIRSKFHRKLKPGGLQIAANPSPEEE